MKGYACITKILVITLTVEAYKNCNYSYRVLANKIMACSFGYDVIYMLNADTVYQVLTHLPEYQNTITMDTGDGSWNNFIE